MNRNRLLAAAILAAASLAPAYAQGSACPAAASLLEIIRPNSTEAVAACPTLVGTWRVTVTPAGGPSFQAINIFFADGNSVEFDNSNPPGAQTIAGGPWQKTGSNSYRMFEVNQAFDPQGNYAGEVQVMATITLDEKGSQFSSKFQVTVLDPEGKVLAQVPGSAAGKRLGFPTP